MKSSLKKRIQLKNSKIKVWTIGNRHKLTHKRKNHTSHIVNSIAYNIIKKSL